MKSLSAENVQTRRTAKSLMDAHRWPLLGLVAVAVCIPAGLSMIVSLLLAPLALQTMGFLLQTLCFAIRLWKRLQL